ncbi:MAG: UbiD family decarboxylase [Desulfovibrio sp.]|nr:UbiD family decarboxylase [Desulfovibrio sp.]
MGYRSLRECADDLLAHGHLACVDCEVDPHLELAAIARRAFRAKAPALLFTRVKGTAFPVLANLFGTRERLHFLFRDSLPALHAVLAARGNLLAELKHPWRLLQAMPGVLRMSPRLRKGRAERIPVLQCRSSLAQLPRYTSWPRDGGPFITLPLVYTEDPDRPGPGASNLGMYRVQLAGNEYAADEVGLHYQIHRGIGAHHAHALAKGQALPVHVYVGGPPGLSVAAVMPLPEGLSELRFAGMLDGARVPMASVEGLPLPVLEQADFCLSGHVLPQCKPEGPFGDHMGYYSLKHNFPVLRVEAVYHRKDAIWPLTSVGRPPQEDTIFGEFIHELTGPLVSQVFPGVREVHAVDVAGVHPLLLAVGSERYTPYEAERVPRELITAGLHLLGNTQTSLAKYVLLAAHEDDANLSARHVPTFLRHMLERVDFATDLHFITRSTTDTLDYTGLGLNCGSKLLWASAGRKRRELAGELSGPTADFPQLPQGFGPVRVAGQGLLALGGPRHVLARNQQDPSMDALTRALAAWPGREAFPLVVVVDDPDFCAASLDNFLWVAFTRSDPATDTYGVLASICAKHWSCKAPLVLDARLKPFHAPPLEEEESVTRRVDALAAPGGPLHGLL